MPSGGGGKVSVDTKPQQDAIAFAKEVFFNYALPFTEQQRGVGQNALSALAYETGLGAAPTIYADQQPAANVSSGGGALGGASEARLFDYAQRLGYDPFAPDFDPSSVTPKGRRETYYGEGGDYNRQIRSRPLQIQLGDKSYTEADFYDQFYTPALAGYQGAQQAPVDPNAPPPENLYRGFQETPGYQFALEQGQRGTANALNAAGVGRDSGALRTALSDHAMGMANQEYGNYISRLAGLAGMGQEGTAMALNAGTGAASQVGQSANAIVNAQTQAAMQNAQSRGSAFGAFGQLLGTGLGIATGGFGGLGGLFGGGGSSFALSGAGGVLRGF